MTETAFYTQSFDIWDLFLQNPLIKRRIEGFRHVRGRLKLRITIAGSPMIYGRYIVAYQPGAYMDPYPKCSSLSECRNMQFCMLPHVFLDPTTGEGGEMTLPFFCQDNYIDLTETLSAIRMGRLWLHTFSPLRSASPGSAKAHVSIFAWMEDAEIRTPTTSQYGSWVEQSEFATNPVSTVASAVARMAGASATIPFFAPYAKATEMVASSIASVATLFGFSRPAILADMTKARVFPMGELSTTNTKEPVLRCGFDSKGELTIDPRTVGLPPVDELSFASIVSRECCFDTFEWLPAAVVDSFLYRINVTPIQFETDSGVTPWRSVLTPTAAAALPFRYWRGTLTYRFQIVASALHRGKLRIAYSPNGFGASTGFNEIHSRIIDLEKERDVEVTVNWHSNTPFLRLRPPAVGTTLFEKGTNPILDLSQHNGQLAIQVLTPLIPPDNETAQGIFINTFIRGHSDFEVAEPSTWLRNIRFISPTPAVEPQSGALESDRESDNNPVGGNALAPMGNSQVEDVSPMNTVFFGESVRSLRTWLRRYQLASEDVQASNNVTRAIRPWRVGISNIEYVLAMYSGWRGSMRFKGAVVNNADNYPIVWGGFDEGGLSSTPQLSNMSTNGMAAGVAVVEFEVPYYYNKRFSPARANPGITTPTSTVSVWDPQRRSVRVISTGTTTTLHLYRSIGEDFSAFFFIGLPPVYAA